MVLLAHALLFRYVAAVRRVVIDHAQGLPKG